jgi:DNA gyrase subunit A
MADLAKEIIPVNLEDEMRRSYLDYAMSVIVGRALPDVRDGLKPVHRRVLFAMNELGAHSNKPYYKSARIVGDVIGKYHPHGDQSVYDTLVRMAQPFSLRYLLVDGQGNFGSVDGDNAAAMRYTEARMAKLTHELMADIDKDTVDFQPNYDEKEQEPTVMPSRFPNLLVNGSAGIAVGMATNIPPHNLSEVINATIALIDEPEIEIDGLMQHIPGPDFPTAGIINGVGGIHLAYRTGRGRVRMRARAEVEVADNGREAIIVTEIPYQVNKARLIEKIAELVKEKKLEGISELRDESDKDGMRIYIEVKRGDSAEVVLNNLYAQTPMESVFGINMVALVDGRPQLLNLKQILEAFVRHRREVVTRRTIFELRKARARAHILEGLTVALANIDEMIELIKTSAKRSPRADAGQDLGTGFGRELACRRRQRRVAAGRFAARRGPERAGSLPAHRNSGQGNPGNAPAPPDRAGAGQADRRVQSAAGHHSRPDRDSGKPRPPARSHSRRIARDQAGIRRRPPQRNPRQRRGPGYPRPDRAGRRGGDAVAFGLCQAPAGHGLSRPAPRRPRP